MKLTGISIRLRDPLPLSVKASRFEKWSLPASSLWIVKGPEADRCEATNITDANAARSMLATMGYEPCLVIKKERSIYFIGQYHITLDYLEGFGHFAEFAIMTDDESLLARYKGELEQLASQFGLTAKDLEHRSYRTLYQG